MHSKRSRILLELAECFRRRLRHSRTLSLLPYTKLLMLVICRYCRSPPLAAGYSAEIRYLPAKATMILVLKCVEYYILERCRKVLSVLQ